MSKHEELVVASSKLADIIKKLPTEDEQKRIEQAWKDMSKTSSIKRRLLEKQGGRK